MVNTFLAEADQILKQQFAQFAKDKLAPLAEKFASGDESPINILKLMGANGYLALNVPAEYGGKNSPFLHLVLLAEALAHYDAGIAIYLAYHAAFIELLKNFATEQQKNTYLSKLAKGEFLGTIAYLENSQNNQETRLVSQANKLILAGNKQLVVSSQTSNNGNAKNYMPNLVAVLAKDNLVLLDLSTAGVEINTQNSSIGFRSINLVNLIFNQQTLNQDALLTTNTTNEAMSFVRDIIKTILAATSLGMAESALNQMTDYVRTAKRNGKPLNESQAVLWKLANAAADTSAARLLTYRAAWSKDENKEVFPKYATMAKSYATQTARVHTGESLQIIPPLLQKQYFDLTSFYIDSKILETFDTTNEEEKVLLSGLLGN